ncbi:hypothetical protein PG994_008461 [Apiospora phragmitis]|uniref:Uncharacterized protein n=1 Tax=Apiospora phragmitis TaxID=2905665 RepID=A0ABR1UGI5_9PEZI
MDLLSILKKNELHPGIDLRSYIRGTDKTETLTDQMAALENLLLVPLPKVSSVRRLAFKVYGIPSRVDIAMCLATSFNGKGDRDWEGAYRHEKSSYNLTVKLHQISLGLRELCLKDTGAGVRIFGQMQRRPRPEWPSLTRRCMDYDQSIIEFMVGNMTLARMWPAPPAQEQVWLFASVAARRVWTAAANAARRMPKLQYMQLFSASQTAPTLEVLAPGAGVVEVGWSWWLVVEGGGFWSRE